MTKNDVLSLKAGDVVRMDDFYVNSKMCHIPRTYKISIKFVMCEDDICEGFLIKRWLVTRKRWTFEFFDVWKMMIKCEVFK